ncbi:biliverdin-producing heme oxygenase [Acinetobacter sp. A47]|uniref:biliverdin-producing heme oxygenase n=1 Tax=Acinetobacter sp. A47 TaxID=1561217 RepID=UPI0005709F83|nr:biliverdin-producing heme oxygenase [Acinetobacter sp. A47]
MNAYVGHTLHNKIKEYTASEHERLRSIMMHSDLFKNLNKYKKFTLAQYYFHCEVEKIFIGYNIAGIFPNIKCRERLQALKQDMKDLYIDTEQNIFESPVVLNQYEALGWLYVSEGSTLGAAIILKGVQEGFCLSEHFGARNLAEHAEGRLQYWNIFTENLNQLKLNREDELFVLNGALNAFQYFGIMLESLSD